ncbi:bifunctional (p)ppGpp synthetase/guanosine-3',5'-bis(diphosphate) 3'-pyrophosphohydrolase [Hylemonella gracilis]|uniref:GTP pyrophosphokinase n=1 Tax=Hylemonella gracilis TaxID=80880 RepID=A0A4P6ULV9_9BURK|nr:bifunctional (p)ppGpp synthetase/guanosine-3',5'-bis(diphosphate) 3'-pyrophosphohydrolase [Hylemonella gracilis]QBK05554.1 bifunctional (p)ppGpp synthetase/guanosine-3',5'-bis(diphosphate) 3'-pyrophosphohydrolase [Hylemonella gracilis]
MKSQAAELAAERAESAAALITTAIDQFPGSPGAAPAPSQGAAIARARAFAEPLLTGETLETGENTLAHADAVAVILRNIGGSEAMQAASYLVYASAYLSKPREAIAKAFGESHAALAVETTQLVLVQRQARAKAQRELHQRTGAEAAGIDLGMAQIENVRKMLLAFSRDLRVVLLRLASRLQTLRWFAASKRALPPGLAAESLHVFAPLANRLGIWEIKWEMEDLAFRFLEPETYKHIARLLDEKRVEREAYVEHLRAEFERELRVQGVSAQVQGRPKHIYSIIRKMRGKSLDFDRIYDVRALRVVVPDVPACYAALSWVHSHFTPVVEEFDDYIARPKPNGYQSLHTVVRDAEGRAIEIQIRTQAMHEHAELGVAAHWAYKEAGAKGYGGGVTADSAYDAKIAVLRQLLAWEQDLSGGQDDRAQRPTRGEVGGVLDDRIYVLTPQATIVDLPQGATPVDFAYSLHTDLGHHCRGARVDGAMVPLNTPLKNGQTVEITAVKEGGPSRDWLNPELGYMVSPRARAKVRAWFNAQAAQETIARGREAVEKTLQREGKTAIKLDDLAAQLGFTNAQALFEVVGKDELSLRSIEAVLRPADPAPVVEADDAVQSMLRRPRSEGSGKGGVLVVGVDSLLTQLAKCCKPAPPDAIRGFVTRGKGVSVHRADCASLQALINTHGERVIDVEWGVPKAGGEGKGGAVYPVDVHIEAADRQGLLRDVSEVFVKEKINVIGAQTQTVQGVARMTLTVEVASTSRLGKVLATVAALPGVWKAKRK